MDVTDYLVVNVGDAAVEVVSAVMCRKMEQLCLKTTNVVVSETVVVQLGELNQQEEVGGHCLELDLMNGDVGEPEAGGVKEKGLHGPLGLNGEDVFFGDVLRKSCADVSGDPVLDGLLIEVWSSCVLPPLAPPLRAGDERGGREVLEVKVLDAEVLQSVGVAVVDVIVGAAIGASEVSLQAAAGPP